MQNLLAPPREGLSEETVLSALSGSRIRHGCDVLDSTDTPTGEALMVSSGRVLWSYRPPDRGSTDVAETRRTAELVIDPPAFPVIARRFRLWTEMQAGDGTWVRFWLGVFLSTLPPLDDDGTRVTNTLTLADKTWRYANRFLTEPLEVPPETVLTDWVVADLTAEFGETSFAIPASTAELVEGRTFPIGTSRLAVYNALLEAAGYDGLTADEGGRPRSVPLDDLAGKAPEWTYEPAGGRIIRAGRVEPLLPSMPNVVRFVARQGPSLAEEDNGIKTMRNKSTGPASIDQRGDRVEMNVDVEAEDQTALVAIARAEAQRYFAGGGLRFDGQIGFNPLHSDRDVIRLIKPHLGLSGDWNVTGWELPLVTIDNESAVLMPITCEARVAVTELEVES